MRVRLALLAFVVALIATGAGTASAAATPKLLGVVGINDAFKITLKTAAGKKVTSVKAGSYKFVVKDGSSIHDFFLEKQTGGTFHKLITGIGFVGTKTLTISLTKGKYKFYCQPHESSMFGFFLVT